MSPFVKEWIMWKAFKTVFLYKLLIDILVKRSRFIWIRDLSCFLEEKVLYNLKRFYQRYVFGTPKMFYTLLKKGSSGFYIEPWGSILGQ